MSYHGALNRLADDTRARVLDMYNAWLEGGLTDDQFIQASAAHIGLANARAVTLGDMAFTVALMAALGAVQPVTGVGARDDQQRLTLALGTLVAAHVAGEAIRARVERLAAAEVLTAAQRGFQEALASSDAVDGWRRRLDADACELCQSWASGDNFFPKTVTMIHHTGCQCTPDPVVRKDK